MPYLNHWLPSRISIRDRRRRRDSEMVPCTLSLGIINTMLHLWQMDSIDVINESTLKQVVSPSLLFCFTLRSILVWAGITNALGLGGLC